MPLRPPRFPLLSLADWDRWARDVPVEPDPESVGEVELKNGGVTETKLANAAVTEDKVDTDAISAAKIQTHAVTNPKLAQGPAVSVVCNPTNALADRTDLAATADGRFLVRRGSALVFDTVADADIPGTIARDAEITAAISTHEAAADPHPGYLTPAEGDALYQPLAAVLSRLYTGTGSPEGVVAAGVGSLYLRQDGGAGTSLYIKESGAGNTGWIAK